MKIPTWAYVAGIWMILIGGCSLLSDYHSINIREINQTQQALMQGFTKSMETENDSISRAKMNSTLTILTGEKDTTQNKSFEETIESMIELSEETIELTITYAYIGLIIYLIYTLSGILLMVRTRVSIPLAIGILIISIAFVLIQSFVLTEHYGSGLIARFAKGGYYFGILLDVIILIIILAGNKSYYKFLPDEEE